MRKKKQQVKKAGKEAKTWVGRLGRFGQWILGLTASGLTLYGVFEILKGKYQHMGLGGY